MAEIKVKSNGLRNELKEIRKSIDKLTEAILQQTNERYGKSNNTNSCSNPDGVCKCKTNKDGGV